MDISKTIAELKQRPDFAAKVGMILVHNGVARSWSRKDGAAVGRLELEVDKAALARLRQEYLHWPGIYEIIVEASSGSFQPADDLLFIVVAGDLREHVKPVLAELLDRIKLEAVRKKELPA
jgi:molybdopterin synthase catalytic subunit